MNKKIIAVIPALNEEDTIAKVTRGVKRYVDEIIVVDDASKDKTVDIAQREGAVILSHHNNQGYDKSIDDGFKLAAQRGADIILTFDADGQHNSDDIPAFTGLIIEDKADLVVGRRPYHARVAEYLFALVAKMKAGVDDPMCGLKAYRIDIYRDIGYFDRISSIGTELMFNAKKMGYRIIQRDIQINRRADDSRFGVRLKGNYKILKAILKVLFI